MYTIYVYILRVNTYINEFLVYMYMNAWINFGEYM